jgi:hypothetical protein
MTKTLKSHHQPESEKENSAAAFMAAFRSAVRDLERVAAGHECHDGKLRFKDLKPGDYFKIGPTRYIKSQHIFTTNPKVDQYCGNVNTINLGTGQASGCGDEVEVELCDGLPQ